MWERISCVNVAKRASMLGDGDQRGMAPGSELRSAVLDVRAIPLAAPCTIGALPYKGPLRQSRPMCSMSSKSPNFVSNSRFRVVLQHAAVVRHQDKVRSSRFLVRKSCRRIAQTLRFETQLRTNRDHMISRPPQAKKTDRSGSGSQRPDVLESGPGKAIVFIRGGLVSPTHESGRRFGKSSAKVSVTAQCKIVGPISPSQHSRVPVPT